ncbi:family 2 encapsulin nanocompartment cargo protein terpene cyclase [Nannocystis pusilla]|uniref:family 2 encapsulin nanocompartment cargo protein terpene cyclase n=1 Tax=Nannocystis pusilla TaxID=889268 RepID=UPI003BF27711
MTEAKRKTDPNDVSALLAGPTGLGTHAARLAQLLNRARAGDLDPPQPAIDPAYAWRSWGDGSASPLYCPITERINEPLADEVDDRLAAWASECGFDDDEIVKIRKTRFGRLVMLTHADCDDPDRLLIGAKMNAAWWAADDYYADDSALGAVPEQLPPRLVLAMAAMDPLPRAGEFSVPLEQAIDAERVLVALRSGLEHMGRYATHEQVQRTCYATFAMFVSWSAYAAWRHTGEYPPAWKYLAARQHDSFYTSMTLCDVIGGYRLPAELFYDARIRRAAFLAGTAVVLVNDLYSVAKDLEDAKPPCNMVLQVKADRGCSIDEATEVTVQLHNDLVRDFEASHRELQAVPSVELQRFLRALRAWMGGAFEWHDSNPRYKTGRKT